MFQSIVGDLNVSETNDQLIALCLKHNFNQIPVITSELSQTTKSLFKKVYIHSVVTKILDFV